MRPFIQSNIYNYLTDEADRAVANDRRRGRLPEQLPRAVQRTSWTSVERTQPQRRPPLANPRDGAARLKTSHICPWISLNPAASGNDRSTDLINC